MNEPAPSTAPAPVQMPKGIGYAYAFAVFNAMSFVIVLGAPLSLYLKSLNASATIISIAGSIIFFTNILQIPGAYLADRVGYKQFLLKGWGSRTFFVMCMGFVVLSAPWLDVSTRIVLILFLVFGYTAVRGITACAFLPWMTKLIPEQVRGQYVSRDLMFVQISVLACNGTIAFYLNHTNTWWQFAPLFFFSFIVGLLSLLFLKRIPEVEQDRSSISIHPVPWREMLGHKPFRALLIFNFFIHFPTGASGILYVPFLRDTFGASDSKILLITMFFTVIVILMLLVTTPLIDRTGSKPFLAAASVLFTIHFIGWCCVSTGILPYSWPSLMLVQFLAAVASCFYSTASIRLAMSVVPEMGRSHFLAIYSVFGSITMGISPVIFGVMIDAMEGWLIPMGAYSFHRYSLFYAILSLLVFVSIFFVRALHEPSAMKTDEFMRELLVKTPARALSRIWPRRPIQ